MPLAAATARTPTTAGDRASTLDRSEFPIFRSFSCRRSLAPSDVGFFALESTMQPLNGTKTHPLKPASVETLRRLAKEALPRQEINPGVANRLERESLVESVDLPSPYVSHKGRLIEHVRATAAGLAMLAQIDRTR
jgi:hypothetical protein